MRLENVIDWSHRLSGEGGPQLTVEMHYLPTLSVNKYKTVLGITRREVQKWMDDLAFVIRASVNSLPLEFKPPVKIRLDGVFQSKTHPDLHNLMKVTADAIEQGLGIDDKHFKTECSEPLIYPGGEPKLIITIGEIGAAG